MTRSLIKTYCLLLLFSIGALYGVQAQVQRGVVSFTTSKNVYVKFDHTRNIEIGDKLRGSNGDACLIVTNKSSMSCVCTVEGDCEINKGDAVIFVPPTRKKEEPIEEKEVEPEVEPSLTPILDRQNPVEIEERKEKIVGRISAASYSNFASARDDRHRVMGRLSLSARNINDSKLSLETYLNYRQVIPSNPENFGRPQRFFRVYNLAAIYEVDPTLTVTLGRKINNKTSSLGAIDGVQAEKNFGAFYVGALAGFRPDLINFSFNPNLFQYGVYAGTQKMGRKLSAQTTLGFIDQRNNNKFDRRYVYFQHSSMINSKLSLFSSMEIDLGTAIDTLAASTNQARLTNLFVSARYRFNRKVNVMVSYDSRKRIVFYESFQTEIERILSDDIARQGVRVRLNVRPIKYLGVGLSFGNRFRTGLQEKSDNYNGYISYSKLPWVGGRLSVRYNLNQSNYLESRILSVRHSRSLLRNKVNADFYYRLASYRYGTNSRTFSQPYYGTRISVNISRRLSLSLAGELTQFNGETNYRINTRLTQRFGTKKK